MRTIFVISGPTNAGKSTIIDILLKSNLNLVRIITANSRGKRPNEVDGRDYHFLTIEDFKQRIESGEFFEWAQVHNDYKGILKTAIYDDIPQDKNAIITLDPQGFMNIKRTIDITKVKVVGIFINVASINEIKRRMAARNTETSQDDIDIRLKDAAVEIDQRHFFDYVVINDDLAECVSEIKEIILNNLQTKE